jgi:hypothetical protein
MSALCASAAPAQTLAVGEPAAQVQAVPAASPAAADTPTTAAAEGQAPAPATKVAPPASTQPPASSRQAEIEQRQAEKSQTLQPYEPNKAEKIFDRLDAVLERGSLRWHPFFDSAYSGGGFTLGLGRAFHVSPYNQIDFRGSYTITGYKRVEAEFIAPRIFNRRGNLSVLGGWREATQVGFYGIGNDTIKEDRSNYLFEQPYGSALLQLYPTRRILMLRGGVEFSQWHQQSGEGSYPSVEELYTPADLPGLGAKISYLHSQGTIGLDGRTSPGYSRRGAYIGATLHDFKDKDDIFGFQTAEYEGIAHLPFLRESWVLSFHGRVQTAFEKDGQEIPFFMLPALGGGSSLRGFSSWRFRDRNSLLLQAEWRIIVNRYLDMAFFYDAGKVTARTSDLDFDGLKDDYGIGFRLHGPAVTPLRIEIARSRESSFSVIFSSSASF